MEQIQKSTRKSEYFKTENRTWVFMLLPALVVMIIISIYPTLFNFYNSLFKWNFARQQIRSFVGFNNYIDTLNDSRFLGALLNTLIFVSASVIIEFCGGFILSLLLFNVHSKGRVYRSLMILPTMVTPIVASLMWLLMYNSDYGIIKYLLQVLGVQSPPALLASHTWAMPAIILVDVWQWTPYVAMCIYAGLVAIPKDIEEAARVDGANIFQKVLLIYLPSLKPVISIVLLMRIIDSFKSFEVVYMLTKGGPGSATELISYYAYKIGFSFFEVGKSSSISLIIVVVITLICSKLNKLIGDEWVV